MKLTDICESFLSRSDNPTLPGKLPVVPKQADTPIIPIERWRLHEGTLHKTYSFRRAEDRERFILALLSYERQVEHHAEMHITEDTISLSLTTRDLGKPTELDREYARYSDIAFKDIVYAPSCSGL